MKSFRYQLTCVVPTCKASFSTHSSNRDKCHKCKPKCRERHVFKKKVVLAPDAPTTTTPYVEPVQEGFACPA